MATLRIQAARGRLDRPGRMPDTVFGLCDNAGRGRAGYRCPGPSPAASGRHVGDVCRGGGLGRIGWRLSIIPPVRGFDDGDGFGDLDASAFPVRQQRILAAIRDWIVHYGYSPSIRQIGDAVGLRSSSSVSKYLACLEERGFLRRGATVSRPIDVRTFLSRSPAREPGGDSVCVPVVGDIAAGIPIAAEEHVDDILTCLGS
jgi:hypothetical protein